ncbi:MAG: type II toxin-antitoxin system PemK/MazF family toxin [Gemmatimonadaceae bacterium]
MQPSAIYDSWDVVVVPFPFVERFGAKRRPAVVLSTADFNGAGNTVLAMITTAPAGEWASDVRIADLEPAGLPTPCVIRFKLFTIDNRLLVRRAGELSARDRAAAKRSLRRLLPR